MLIPSSLLASLPPMTNGKSSSGIGMSLYTSSAFLISMRWNSLNLSASSQNGKDTKRILICKATVNGFSASFSPISN